VDGHGTVHEYQVPSGGPINSIVLGPGSDVWFTDPANDRIGVLNSATGNVTEWATPTAGGWPLGLTRGPDGLLYFTERSAAKIARWNADGSFTEWDLAPDAFPNRIVVGPDHALWFTELLSGMIGRLDTAGNLTETPIDGGPVGITTGPDGQLYVALFFDGAVARLDGTGAVTERWALPHGALIVGASRDSVWATNGFDDSVARLRTSC
jgi:virginiamycin B lyase